jgi:hypothetical protein
MRRLCIVYLPLRIRVVVGVKVKMGLCAGCSLDTRALGGGFITISVGWPKYSNTTISQENLMW